MTYLAKALSAFILILAATAMGAASTAHATYGVGLYGVKQKPARDLNPDPNIVEVKIVAKENRVYLGNGVKTKMWTYNGTVPGPLIEGKVGDTLIVHFKNKLPEETTVHWHGVEVPAHMDGSNIAQKAVPPGGEFRYEFKLLKASTYWFHPHIRGAKQVELGLYGALVVKDPATDSRLGLPTSDNVLMFDDILLDKRERVVEGIPSDPLERSNFLLNGREGNKLLVNGKIRPSSYVRAGEPQRFRIVNTSNSRFMRLSIPHHEVYRIGGDAGLLDAPEKVEPIRLVPDPDGGGGQISDPDQSKGIFLTPGERADIIVVPKSRRPIRFIWHDLKRGRHKNSIGPGGAIMLGDDETDGKASPKRMLKLVQIGPGNPRRAKYHPPSHLAAAADRIPLEGARKVKIELGHTPPDSNGDVIFFVQRKENNGQCPLPPGVPCPLPFPKVTPADAPAAQVGETLILEVNNLTGGIHNFHLHGFFFQHIETQFFDMDNPENNKTVLAETTELKDTIQLPPRTGARARSRSVTRLAVKIDDTGREGMVIAFGKTPGEHSSGGWLFHCHILEHSSKGMMSFLQVLPD